MKKTLLISALTVILLLFANQAIAETSGAHGEISGRYNLDTNQYPDRTWFIDLHYTFKNGFALGTSHSIYSNGFLAYMNNNPMLTPPVEIFELYSRFNFNDQISVKLGKWFSFPVNTGGAYNILHGLYIEGKYQF